MAKKTITRRTISDAQLKAELINLFESGNTDRGKCKGVLRSSYQLQEQRYYKIANIAYTEWQELKQKSIAEQVANNTKDGLKKAVMTADERREYLTKIILCDTDVKTVGKSVISVLTHEDGRKEIITVKDKLSALAELNKMQGDYAPSKVAQTDKDGNDLERVKINIIMPNDEDE